MKIPRRIGFAVLILAVVSAGFAATAANSAVRLKVGDKAPSFQAKDDQGKLWKSADHVGKKILVVYFYPADLTSTSVKQATGFRDEMKAFAERDVQVIGVSGDAVRNHQLFKKLHRLNFPLLSDEDGHLAKAFGVPLRPGGSIKRTIDGRQVTLTRGVTAARWTFVVDLKGKIAVKQTKVVAANNGKAVLDAISRAGLVNNSIGSLTLPRTDSEWRRRLTRKQYLVTRRKHTEKAFTGKYWNTKTKGIYKCVCCGQDLFQSRTKFRSGTGWPSFFSPATKPCVKYAKDKRRGTTRIEVLCSRCDAHLGHVFSDGPPPTGKRYCINSASLLLQKE